VTIAGIEPQRGEGMFLLDFHPPLGVDSTDVCFSLTVPRGKRRCKPFCTKGFLLYLASVSVDTLSKITITNGALGWYQFL